MVKNFIIAIDGPSAAGKGTIASLLRQYLQQKYSDFTVDYIDTGIFYRIFAKLLSEALIYPHEEDKIKALLSHKSRKNFLNDFQTLLLKQQNNREIYNSLRDEQVSRNASKIASISLVREFINQFQLSLVANIQNKQIIILDGRDIGTVIAPNAQVKLFITALVAVRAKRRYNDLNDKSVTLQQVTNELIKRDKADKERAISPLKIAADAVIIDNSELSIDEIIAKIILIISAKVENNIL